MVAGRGNFCQVQLLKNENKKLRAQIEDEERLAEEVQHRPPPEGLEQMSASDLGLGEFGGMFFFFLHSFFMFGVSYLLS